VIELDFFKSVLLGIIQGLTEFLPISSSGHLALVQHYFGLDPTSPGMLLFDVLAHCGTLIAVCIVFARPAGRFLRRLMRELSASRPRRRHALHIALLAIAACIPTGIAGLAFKEQFEQAFDSPKVIGSCLIVTGLLLVVMAWLPRGRRGWKDFRWWQAGIVGAAQAAAILPGISRSGATICTASYLGLRRRWAAEFSFLIAVPAIAAATVLKLRDVAKLPPDQLDAITWGPIFVGSLVSLAVGVVALILLLSAVRRAKLHYFAPYCWLLGAYILISMA
jgi:undecaprenyl-diphosphatase